MAERDAASARAVLLTGVGKRYDIVSAFAEHAFTIAADPNPLAPAQYAADLRVAPPRIDDPGYVPFLEGLVAEHDVGAVVPLTDLDIEVLAAAGDRPARVRARRPRSPRDVRQVRDAPPAARRTACRRRRRCCPARSRASYPVMVKPRRGSGARSIHPAADRAEMEFFVGYVKEPVMVQRLMGGPEFSIDLLCDLDGRCLNAIPRTMIESRGGESIKGTVIDDEELIELGRRVGEALGVRGPCTVQAFRDPEIGLGITDVNTRFGGAFPAPMYAALPGPHLPRADRADGARRGGRAARRRVRARPHVHALLLAARARPAAAPDRPRHRRRRARAGPRPAAAEPGRNAPKGGCARSRATHAWSRWVPGA